ncbi:MAG: MinD/ParA family protein [Planctomycetes bacterium]|nr:MinD/ParA family protein [Planctomycetota bacterium]
MGWLRWIDRLPERRGERWPVRRPLAGPRALRSSTICVASGKGGTGKSVVTASLATLIAERGRTLLVDADLGVGNAHILQDVQPTKSLADLVQGRASARELVVPCRRGLDLIAAGSGVSRMASLAPHENRRIAEALEELDKTYDFVVVDSGAGISPQTISFAAASDVVLIVTTPDVTAMTDAYAFLKVLSARATECVPLVIVNRIAEPGEGERVAHRLGEVAQKFLGRELRFFGALPEDRAVVRSVAARRAVVLSEPGAAISLALRGLVDGLLAELEHAPRAGLGHTLHEHLSALEP